MFDTIAKHFQKLLKRNRLAHAYIIESTTQHSTKLNIEIRQALNVLEQDTQMVSPENHSITVNQIRSVIDRVSRKPIGHMHLVIIYPADQMNTSACNALLKCLEEPPGNTCFLLLTTSQQKLLPTIRSRSQIVKQAASTVLHFQNHPEYTLIRHLYQHNPAILDEDILGVVLYRQVLQAQNPLYAIHQLGKGHPSELLQLSIQIIAYLISQSPKKALWDIYDHLMSLNRYYQHAHTLNEKTVLDHIGLSFSKVHQI